MAKVLLISSDNDSHIPFFPMNLFYLAGALKKAGHTVGIWLQDIHHGREEALTKILDENPFDVVGLGFVAGYYQYEKGKRIKKAVNNSIRRKEIIYVLGGHGPAGIPEFFYKAMGADSIVIGDGEKVICEIADGKKGIIQGEPCTQDEAPLGIYKELFPIMVYRLIRWPTSERKDFCFPILSSRGCKYHCSFCYRMREGFHERNVEAIMEEIKFLHGHFQINHFQFSDELLMSSERRTLEICQAISKLPYRIKWDCNGRLNFAKTEVLREMKNSGCEYVNYGIESLNPQILKGMGKGLSVDQIYQGVEATLQQNLKPGLNLLWGFPEDDAENLRASVKFLLKYDPCHELRTIRPITPYPGTPLYKLAIEKGLLEGPEDFYERKHKNSDLFTVNFMDLPIQDAHEQLFEANLSLYSNYMDKCHDAMYGQMKSLYMGNNIAFRGFRAV